jgi:hypothetical protein
MLAEHEGAASGDQRHWAARVVIPEQGPVYPVHPTEQAGFLGKKLAADAASVGGLPDWPIVRIDVFPELLGAQEAAVALGVSRQRLHELRRSMRFSVPVAELGNGPVWSGSAVRGSWPAGSACPALARQGRSRTSPPTVPCITSPPRLARPLGPSGFLPGSPRPNRSCSGYRSSG